MDDVGLRDLHRPLIPIVYQRTQALRKATMNQRLALLLAGSVVVALMGGCATQAPPPSAVATMGATDSPEGMPSSARATPDASESPTGDVTIDPATFLQLCAGWPDDAAGGNPIECDRLVRTALEGVIAGGPVSRVETSYACVTSCKPPDPDRGYVIVISAAGTVEVEVARQADGTYAVVGTTPFVPPDHPPFDAPPASAPVVDGAPASVNAREPLPLCGVETRMAGEPFDVAGRQCFWDGVVAGSPVEFVAIGRDTEGLLTTMIHRYDGTGGVELITNDEGGWSRTVAGVEPVPHEGWVFGLAGLTDRQPIPAE